MRGCPRDGRDLRDGRICQRRRDGIDLGRSWLNAFGARGHRGEERRRRCFVGGLLVEFVVVDAVFVSECIGEMCARRERRARRLGCDHRNWSRGIGHAREGLLAKQRLLGQTGGPRAMEAQEIVRSKADAAQERERLEVGRERADQVEPCAEIAIDGWDRSAVAILRGEEQCVVRVLRGLILGVEQRVAPRVVGAGPNLRWDALGSEHVIERPSFADTCVHRGVLRERDPAYATFRPRLGRGRREPRHCLLLPGRARS